MKRTQHLSRILKVSRENADLTQADVSVKFGYTSPQFISNMERGICAIPTPLLPRFSKIYNVPLSKLIDAKVKDYREKLIKKCL